MSLVVLRAAGAALVLDVEGPALPRVVHWGGDVAGLADDAGMTTLLRAPVPHNGPDEAWPLTLLPTEADGWAGHPGIAWHRGGGHAAPRLRLDGPPVVQNEWGTGGSVVVTGTDEAASVQVEVRLTLDPHGVLRTRVTVRSTADSGLLDLVAVRVLLPLPPDADEVLDLTGRWCREKAPQRSPLQQGTHLRASRRGRTGHDATGLLVAGTAGFGFRHGEVRATHVAWSGDHEHLVEALPEGAGDHAAVIGGGELLRGGEVRLGPGEEHVSPEVVHVWSGVGLDGISDRLHRSLRARPHHPSTPRPLVLNSWEAVYFSTDTEQVLRLVDAAADVGVERFVLDDGWFGARRDDTRGLGDWVVSDEVWPQGLHPLAERVRAHGMQLGLWFEPEMVNLDSDLVRAHPDWVLGPAGTPPRPSRHQQLLDLTRPEVVDHLLVRIGSLVEEYGIDVIKWDHNRDLLEAVTGAHGVPSAPAVHAQTLALYDLLDRLRAAHPGLEVESCSSGGARVDLGVLERTDRVWTSDCNDAVERQQIQRWTTLLLPPELVGAHVGPPVAHTTGRSVDLSMRTATALFGHAGIEWDVTSCTPAELDALRAWAGLYREVRPLLHSGAVVRADLPGEDVLLHGVAAHDGSEALLAYVRLATGPAGQPGRVRIPGLDPHRRYRLRVRPEAGLPRTVQISPPGWWDDALAAGVHLGGDVLGAVGLPMPVLGPQQALVLHLLADGTASDPAADALRPGH